MLAQTVFWYRPGDTVFGAAPELELPQAAAASTTTATLGPSLGTAITRIIRFGAVCEITRGCDTRSPIILARRSGRGRAAVSGNLASRDGERGLAAVHAGDRLLPVDVIA